MYFCLQKLKRWKLKKICFDIDGVICKLEKIITIKKVSLLKNIRFINNLKDKGFKIIFLQADWWEEQMKIKEKQNLWDISLLKIN